MSPPSDDEKYEVNEESDAAKDQSISTKAHASWFHRSFIYRAVVVLTLPSSAFFSGNVQRLCSARNCIAHSRRFSNLSNNVNLRMNFGVQQG